MDPRYIDSSNSKNSKGNSESKGSGDRGSNAPRRPVVPVRVPPAHRAGLWNLQICPTTGGKLDLMIPCTETVEGLKRAIAKSLRIPKERINLLHKERLMKEGPMLAYGVGDGSKVTLLPNVETGLVSQKPDHSVMQALENLSEGQVNDFLTGKCPLTLAMRLGDHMMFVQLQLSTTNGMKRAHASPSHHHTSAKRRRHHAGAASSSSSAAAPSSTSTFHHHHHHHHHHRQAGGSASGGSAAGPSTSSPTNSARGAVPPTYPSLSLTCTHPAAAGTMQATLGLERRSACPATATATYSVREGSSSPVPGRVSGGASGREMLPNKLAATCLPGRRCQCPGPNSKRVSSSPPNPASMYTPRASSVCPLPPTTRQQHASPLPVPAGLVPTAPSPTPSSPATSSRPSPVQMQALPARLLVPPPVRAAAASKQPVATAVRGASTSSSRASTSSASTQQGEKAGSSSSSSTSSASASSKSSQQGAIIESMHHLGHGVYSGTFSGTLNPALQDQAGKPRRSLNTIVHILNDLLGATPEYAAYYGSRIPSSAHHEHGASTHRLRSSHSSRHAKKVNNERVHENKALKGKVQQLQQKLQEKRERLRAKRAARSGPYPWTNPQPSECEASNEPVDSDQSMDVTAAEVDVSQGDVDSANFTEQIKPENNTGDAELKHTGTIVA